MLVETLRHELKAFFKEKSFKAINTNFDTYLINNGLGFFPYGSGLLNSAKEIPKDCYLFLGHDFGSVEYANRIKEIGEKNESTLRNLLKEIIDDEYKEQVFLSNVFMGLREGETSNIKKFPAFENDEYKQVCKEFLEFQITHIKPFRVITLGQKTEMFIRQNLPKIKTFNIIHPSFYYSNLKRSKKLTNKEDIKSYVFDYLRKIYKMKSWFSFDDDINEAAEEFHKDTGIFPNIVVMNLHTYSQVNFLLTVSPKRKNIVDDEGEAEIEVGTFNYFSCSLAVATYWENGALADMEFELVYDTGDDDDDDENQDTPLTPTGETKQTTNVPVL